MLYLCGSQNSPRSFSQLPLRAKINNALVRWNEDFGSFLGAIEAHHACQTSDPETAFLRLAGELVHGAGESCTEVASLQQGGVHGAEDNATDRSGTTGKENRKAIESKGTRERFKDQSHSTVTSSSLTKAQKRKRKRKTPLVLLKHLESKLPRKFTSQRHHLESMESLIRVLRRQGSAVRIVAPSSLCLS